MKEKSVSREKCRDWCAKIPGCAAIVWKEEMTGACYSKKACRNDIGGRSRGKRLFVMNEIGMTK
jgi:hypothetical protein